MVQISLPPTIELKLKKKKSYNSIGWLAHFGVFNEDIRYSNLLR